MKRRAPSSTSERELVELLAKGGRIVPLSALAGWRKGGLLPPLSSYGLRHAGRSYYWSESDILARAELVFDLLKRHVQNDWVLWGLWLRGFPVPAEKLRRIWPQCNRVRKPWSQSPSAPLQHRSTWSSGDSALQGLVAILGKTSPPDKQVAALIDQVVMHLDRPGGPFHGLSKSSVWPLLQMNAFAIEASAALRTADDKTFVEAQRYLQAASAVLEDCSGEVGTWDNWLADAAGPTLAFVILGLLGAGQAKALDELAEQLRTSRQSAAVKSFATVATRCRDNTHADKPRKKVGIS